MGKERTCSVCCGNGMFNNSEKMVECDNCAGTGKIINREAMDIGPAPDDPNNPGSTGQ